MVETLMFIFLAIITAGMIYLKIKMPAIKGHLGEKSVAMTLSFLPDDKYVVLNNLMFKSGSRTTQIDHIVISVYGIFIIETKNYKGWIFGNANKDYWTQNIWGNKYSLYNPVFQNKNHIKFLINKFDFFRGKENYLYPIVVFLNASKLNLSGDCDCVLWRNELNKYIKSYQQEIFTLDDCQRIASFLISENITDKKERNNHKSNVRTAASFHENMIEQGICPRCGGMLMPRTGRYGNFYGCSNYPRV